MDFSLISRVAAYRPNLPAGRELEACVEWGWLHVRDLKSATPLRKQNWRYYAPARASTKAAVIRERYGRTYGQKAYSPWA